MIVGVLLVLAAVGWIVVRNSLLPLDRIGHTAGRIAGGDLSHRVEVTDERTEVGRVGVALNRMLDRLEDAFTERRASEDRLRQFIADASHELRTPLASIRGYAELYRMGAARSDEDVEKAMRRIEDEAARMGVLVEDLLTLARLDEVADAPHAQVDLAPLARDTVADAHATAPGRAIAVHADGPARRARRRPPAAPGTRQPRPQRARPHPRRQPDRGQRRPRGRRGAARGPRPRPRPPHRRPDALFERFWRAEGGRERGKSGAGLGLAIVAGIVGAHGGPRERRQRRRRRRRRSSSRCPARKLGRAKLRTPRTGNDTAGAASVLNARDMPSFSACWPSGSSRPRRRSRHRGRPGAIREDHLAGVRPLHRRSDRWSGAPNARTLLADRRLRPVTSTRGPPGIRGCSCTRTSTRSTSVLGARQGTHAGCCAAGPDDACTSLGPATGAAARNTRPTSPTPRSGVRGSGTPAAVWPAAIAASTSTT